MKTLILPVFWSLVWSIAAADTLQPLGDEFNDAATFSQWQDIDEVEGWVLVAAPFLGDNANVELGRLALDAASFSADESVGVWRSA